jgi:hemerythrin
MKIAKMTMTQMRDLMYKKEATGTEIFDALIKEMRERKTKTSAQKVMRFVSSFSSCWQHITDEDIALFEEIRRSSR